jgi:hypothetical protein
MIDVRLDALPQDRSWSRIDRSLVCKEFGAIGSVHIVPNWFDARPYATRPVSPAWKQR